MNLHIWIRCSWFYIVRRYFCDLKWSQIKVCISLTRKTILLAHPSIKYVTNAVLRTAEMFEIYILCAFNTSTNELKWPSSILNFWHPLLRAMISFNCDFTPIKKMSEVLYAVKGGSISYLVIQYLHSVLANFRIPYWLIIVMCAVW